MALSPKTAALIAKARENHEKRMAELAAKQEQKPQLATYSAPPTPPQQHTKLIKVLTSASTFHQTVQGVEFNEKQLEAIELGMRAKSFCLIGAAGTGKTTTTREVLAQLCKMPHVAPIEKSTQYLQTGTPGIVIISFTNKAVNNIKKFLPPELADHCMTYHKLLEYAPVWYEEKNADGEDVKTMRFEPTFGPDNFLPHLSTVIVEEGSMVGVDLHQQLLNALPNPSQTQFIFLGDLNQLPPIFGPSILGFKLVDLQTVELTHVYRQALLSPIIELAHKIREGRGWYHDKSAKLPLERVTVDAGEHGVLRVIPWKKKIDKDVARNTALERFILPLITRPDYDFENTMILCPFNKSFGTILLNQSIASALAKQRNAEVWEVIARYRKSYWAIGDRVLHDRREAIIVNIFPTPGYDGPLPRAPSLHMNRRGQIPKELRTEEHHEIEKEKGMAVLEALEVGNDQGKNLASHTITVRFVDSNAEIQLNSAGAINSLLFSYVLTVHKSQGSEAKRVIILLHGSHNSMLSRELLYTAVTRAKHELIILCEPDRGEIYNSITKAAKSPEITGVTLKEKIAFFLRKMKEYKPSNQMELEGDEDES